VATSSPECRSLRIEPCPLTDPPSCLGRKVRTVVLRLAQPKRLCEHGPSLESSQCCSSLGYRHSHHIFAVSLEQPCGNRAHSCQIQLYFVDAPCKSPDLTEPTLAGSPNIHIPFSETRPRPEALGMRQDHKVETKRNRYGKRCRTARGRRSMPIDRREILHTRWWFR
jgi:hypothetical protein